MAASDGTVNSGSIHDLWMNGLGTWVEAIQDA
jgi:hypothetical protein